MKKTYKHLLPGIFFCLVSSGVLAQEQQPALASIIYEFVHVNDTNNRNKPVKEEMVLHLGQTSSVYKSLTKEKRMAEAMKKVEEMLGPQRAGQVGLSSFSISGIGGGITNEELFQLRHEDKLVILDRLGQKDYLIENPIPKIDWEIKELTKEIGGYECQQAVGQYAGRDYTAWFYPELPLSAGPWKFSGLPGIILEIGDSREEVLFKFKELQKHESHSVSIGLPESAIKTDEKAFARAKVAFEENPTAGRQAPPPGATVVRSFRDASGREITEGEAKANRAKAQKEAKERNNNPIELDKRS